MYDNLQTLSRINRTRIIIACLLIFSPLSIALSTNVSNTAIARIDEGYTYWYCRNEVDTTGTSTSGDMVVCYYTNLFPREGETIGAPPPRILPDGSGEVLKYKRWDELLDKAPYFQCQTTEAGSSCFVKMKPHDTTLQKNICLILGAVACTALAVSVCAPPTAATAPVVPVSATVVAVCGALITETCKKTIVDPICAQVAKGQRKLIPTFPPDS